jgi:glycosyltransferase involved in cell wall biosynthesis
VTEDSVSVVIPVRNGERFLAEAIESAIGQSRPPQEVIVVDDGSTDSTSAVAGAFESRVRYVGQPPLGVATALNCGVDLARGELLAFLDADDVWTHEKLERQHDALREQPRIDAVFGHLQNVRDGRGSDEILPGWSRGTMLIRRQAFARVGRFADWRLGEFVEWYARAVDAGLVLHMLPDVLLLRRLHDGNVGVRLRDRRYEYTHMLKTVLDRRRADRS